MNCQIADIAQLSTYKSEPTLARERSKRNLKHYDLPNPTDADFSEYEVSLVDINSIPRTSKLNQNSCLLRFEGNSSIGMVISLVGKSV